MTSITSTNTLGSDSARFTDGRRCILTMPMRDAQYYLTYASNPAVPSVKEALSDAVSNASADDKFVSALFTASDMISVIKECDKPLPLRSGKNIADYAHEAILNAVGEKSQDQQKKDALSRISEAFEKGSAVAKAVERAVYTQDYAWLANYLLGRI